MTFLAPWALAVGAVAAAAMLALHLVARQRPAAYVLPTTRFVPDRRTLVSRAARRPRDLLLLALRVLLLLAMATAFARPVLTPSRGTTARIILLDRSGAVGNAPAALARARELAGDETNVTVIAFDNSASAVPPQRWDSLAGAMGSSSSGSLSAAFVAARRASTAIAEHADSIRLIVVSPVARSEMDSATTQLRASWPGAIAVERVELRAEVSEPWRLEHAVTMQDPLGPATVAQRGTAGSLVTRLVRGGISAADSEFARRGKTIVRWDSASARHPIPAGLTAGGDVIVASLERSPLALRGRAIALWADGAPAAVEAVVGKGCIREVGIALPAAGDIALHPPFQRIVRSLLMPCGTGVAEQPADSVTVAGLAGKMKNAAPARAFRNLENATAPLVRWLLASAIVLAAAELLVRGRSAPDVA